jgi:trk system potassium uptake protein
MSIIILGSVFVTFLIWFFFHKVDIFDSVFQWISSLTTTGFSVMNVEKFPAVLKLFLIIGMFIGGSVGSAAGGFKIARFKNLILSISVRLKSEIKKAQEKKIVKNIKEEDVCENCDKEIADIDVPHSEKTSRLYSASVMFFIWISTIVLGWFFIMLVIPQKSSMNALFDVVSALSNVGLSCNVVDVNMAVLPKCIFTILMWVGRLEIIPVIYLFGYGFLKEK